MEVSNLKYINPSEETYSIKIKAPKYKEICKRTFIGTLSVVTKNWKQTYYEVLQLFKSLATDNIHQLLREEKASIRAMCSHDPF